MGIEGRKENTTANIKSREKIIEGKQAAATNVWSAPYQDKNGNTVQDNKITGRQVLVTRAPKEPKKGLIKQLRADAAEIKAAKTGTVPKVPEGKPSEDWITRAMKLNNVSRDVAIANWKVVK